MTSPFYLRASCEPQRTTRLRSAATGDGEPFIADSVPVEPRAVGMAQAEDLGMVSHSAANLDEADQ